MYDLAIRNGTVIDGTGGPARRADVAVSGGVVAADDGRGFVVGEEEAAARIRSGRQVLNLASATTAIL